MLLITYRSSSQEWFWGLPQTKARVLGCTSTLGKNRRQSMWDDHLNFRKDDPGTAKCGICLQPNQNMRKHTRCNLQTGKGE